MNRRHILVGAISLVLGVGIGVGVASSDDQATVDTAVTAAIAAVTPAPTPTPVEVTVEVAVVPQACLDAIDLGAELSLDPLNFMVDVLDAYLDYPDENLAEFGGRVENLISTTDAPSDAIMADWEEAIDDCRGAA